MDSIRLIGPLLINGQSNDASSIDKEETSNEEVTKTCTALYKKLVQLVKENIRFTQLMLESK